jgi:hypothetical protein
MFLSILATYINTTRTVPKEKLPKSLTFVDLFLNKLIKSANIVDDKNANSCKLH